MSQVALYKRLKSSEKWLAWLGAELARALRERSRLRQQHLGIAHINRYCHHRDVPPAPGRAPFIVLNQREEYVAFPFSLNPALHTYCRITRGDYMLQVVRLTLNGRNCRKSG
ncbi:MAG: hypothetical protein ABSD31_16295 [Candidatus Binataceae bacterium]|jgi:hypothetical protein